MCPSTFCLYEVQVGRGGGSGGEAPARELLRPRLGKVLLLKAAIVVLLNLNLLIVAYGPYRWVEEPERVIDAAWGAPRRSLDPRA